MSKIIYRQKREQRLSFQLGFDDLNRYLKGQLFQEELFVLFFPFIKEVKHE